MTPEDIRFFNRIAVKKYRATNRKAVNRRKRTWARSANGQASQQAWYLRNKERLQQTGKARRAALRAEIIQAYGGKCLCCGEASVAFLTLDHIYGGGTYHRRHAGSYDGVYADLKKQGFPKDKYRLLCMNCNFATRWGKSCPHQIALFKAV